MNGKYETEADLVTLLISNIADNLLTFYGALNGWRDEKQEDQLNDKTWENVVGSWYWKNPVYFRYKVENPQIT